MTRLIDQEVIVDSEPGTFGPPSRFKWRGRWYTVRRLLDLWTEAGAWWDGEQETVFFRVAIDRDSVCELLRQTGGKWRLYRMYD